MLYYAAIVKLLINLKTKEFKKNFNKKQVYRKHAKNIHLNDNALFIILKLI